MVISNNINKLIIVLPVNCINAPIVTALMSKGWTTKEYHCKVSCNRGGGIIIRYEWFAGNPNEKHQYQQVMDLIELTQPNLPPPGNDGNYTVLNPRFTPPKPTGGKANAIPVNRVGRGLPFTKRNDVVLV